MEYIPINPKTIINISPQKYGYKHLEDLDTLKTLPQTTIFINNSSEIESLARMITSVVDEECETKCTFQVITTKDNKAFIDRFYQLIIHRSQFFQIVRVFHQANFLKISRFYEILNTNPNYFPKNN